MLGYVCAMMGRRDWQKKKVASSWGKTFDTFAQSAHASRLPMRFDPSSLRSALLLMKINAGVRN